MEIRRFPNKLKLFRRRSNLSRKKVARHLGFADTSMLSRWECGLAMPNLMQAFCLAQAYGILPHELFQDQWNLTGDQMSVLAPQEPFNSNMQKL
jgi:transcriptional regulator with XRE-family HTH domain